MKNDYLDIQCIIDINLCIYIYILLRLLVFDIALHTAPVVNWFPDEFYSKNKVIIRIDKHRGRWSNGMC